MTSSKPYLLRALYEWIVDNEMTPYIVIDAQNPTVQVPLDYVDDGRIILNISPVACRGLHIENDRIVFTARFSGIAHQIYAPPSAILAIYSKETGRGMVFAEEEPDTIETPDQTPPNTEGDGVKKLPIGGRAKTRPALKVVK